MEQSPAVAASNWVPLFAGAVAPGSTEAVAAVQALNSSGRLGPGERRHWVVCCRLLLLAEAVRCAACCTRAACCCCLLNNRPNAGLIDVGGAAMSLVETGEQWDAPNVWPPIDWMLIDGAERYGGEAGAQLAEQASCACVCWGRPHACPAARPAELPAPLPSPAPPHAQLATGFLSAVWETYQETGRMFEKFNAKEVQGRAGPC